MLVVGKGAEAQTGHSYYFDGVEEWPRYFIIFTVEVSAHLCVTPVSHFYVQYSDKRKGLLKESFMTKEVKILPSFVVVGHVDLQHAGSQWRAEHYIRYRSYLVLENCDLPDAIVSAYGDCTVKNASLVFRQ